LAWDGYGGGSPVTDSLVSLLRSRYFMASTVILSAILESSIRDLVWAALVDNGVDRERANKVADGRMNRVDSLGLVASLTGLRIKDLSFPYRNLVAHGKGFGVPEGKYQAEIETQIRRLREWVDDIKCGQTIANYCPPEVDRWLLFMSHWSGWLESYWAETLAGG
jgi:hypothetical protein